MPPARNLAVAHGRLAVTGYQLVYTVPVGYVFIIKAFHAYNVAAAAANVAYRLQSSVPSFAVLDQVANLAANTAHNWYGWTVLNAGDAVYLQTDQQPIDYWVAGALLPVA